jgi:hypothetical protein
MKLLRLIRLISRKRVSKDPLNFDGLDPLLAKMLTEAEEEIVKLNRELNSLKDKYEPT